MNQITEKQERYLVSLIVRHGKPAYQSAKKAVGIDAETILIDLSKAEATRLIDHLRGQR